jgi:23S rRNA (guanosine2251-2'-O)-methyltransferase
MIFRLYFEIMTHSKVYIYGKHALMEALSHAPHSIEEVFVAAQFDDTPLRDTLKKTAIRTTILTSKTMPREVEASAVHQGIIGLLSFDRLVQPFEKFVEKLKIMPDTSLVLLGELSDPQNVGAIIRSAAAFGISGVLIPEHNQVQITGSVVKVSAGMAFRIPLVSVSNVNSTLRDLKDRGFAVYGLAGEGKYTVTKEEFQLPTLFILGNEAEGIREKTRELCDKLLSIPMNPNCESLNAAASATVAFYAWSAKHPKALRLGN